MRHYAYRSVVLLTWKIRFLICTINGCSFQRVSKQFVPYLIRFATFSFVKSHSCNNYKEISPQKLCYFSNPYNYYPCFFQSNKSKRKFPNKTKTLFNGCFARMKFLFHDNPVYSVKSRLPNRKRYLVLKQLRNVLAVISFFRRISTFFYEHNVSVPSAMFIKEIRFKFIPNDFLFLLQSRLFESAIYFHSF